MPDNEPVEEQCVNTMNTKPLTLERRVIVATSPAISSNTLSERKIQRQLKMAYMATIRATAR